MVIIQRSPSLVCACNKLLKQTSRRCFTKDVSFQDLGINRKLTRLLRSKGIYNPTDIQEKAIQTLIAGESVVVNSETGSGKTLTYALPIVNTIQEMKRRGLKVPCPYGLIVVPTSELQYQVTNVFSKLLNTNVIPANEDIPLRLLDTEVVVSTAQFLMTFHLDVFRQVQTVVFDEADLMIAKKVGKHGRKDPLFNLIHKFLEPSHFKCFHDGGKHISDAEEDHNGDNINARHHDSNFNDNSSNTSVNTLNIDNNNAGDNNIGIFRDKRQFVFAGATMPTNESPKAKVAMNYINYWVPDINVIQTENTHKPLTNVATTYTNVLEGNKLKLLVQTLKDFPTSQKLRVLVFVNTLNAAESLHHSLTQSNHSKLQDFVSDSGNFLDDLNQFLITWRGKIHLMHKKVSLDDRLEAFSQFSTAQRSLMITTDIASRGLDFPDIDLVVQYDFAKNVIDILHRAGRTGRIGKEGKVVNFVTEDNERLAGMIQDAVNNGQSLDNLFSRRRSLSRKIKRHERAERCDETDDGIENSEEHAV